MLRVVLVNPPQYTDYSQMPMGLGILAAVLEARGYRVRVIDANALGLESEDLPGLMGDVDVFGITAMTPTLQTAIDIVKQVKKARPKLHVILGGVHATLLPEETIALAPEIDTLVCGEGEYVFPELLQRITDGLPKVVKSSSVVNLDALPFSAYHLLPIARYRVHAPHGRLKPFAPVITSRGCPYRCIYCSKAVFGSKFRAQSPERVISELKYLKARFGVKEIAFYDDVFTMDKKRVHELCDLMLREDMRLLWSCETRVNLVDKELLSHMKQAGCFAIFYGIESGSQKILDGLRKGITLDEVEEAVIAAKDVGLEVAGYFMFGSPGETQETIRGTISFAKRLPLDYVQFTITTPFPGTELYEQLGDVDAPWSRFIYGGQNSRKAFAFSNRQFGGRDIENWIKYAYREFYMRPSYVWQRLKYLRSINEVRTNIAGLGMLLRRM